MKKDKVDTSLRKKLTITGRNNSEGCFSGMSTDGQTRLFSPDLSNHTLSQFFYGLTKDFIYLKLVVTFQFLHHQNKTLAFRFAATTNNFHQHIDNSLEAESSYSASCRNKYETPRLHPFCLMF